MADFPPTPPPTPAPPSPPPYPAYGPPPPPRRLMRSSRERMWAGVAGGMAEYFELDPSLVRLLWVAATVVTGGLTVPVYILAWIILPRDDRTSAVGPTAWHDWSEEFHAETQRLADEARRVADNVREASHSWHAPEAGAPPSPASSDRGPAGDTGYVQPTSASAEDPWWRSERYVERQRAHHSHSKSTGVVLVALGILLLAANAGVFRWIDGRTMWPLILIGLGVILLGRQSGWWSR